jgi:nitrous oxide reductase accessory protein NosL
MAIRDLRFASARGTRGAARAYDAIECLLRDSTATGPAWLPDHDQAALHAADSMWVVRGDLPSPMGGGFVAFLDRAAADEVAAARSGRVGRISDFAAGAPR